MSDKKRILVLCPYPEHVAPSQRLKYEQYFDHFRENNIEVVVAPFMSWALWKIVYKKGYLFQKFFLTMFGYLSRTIDLFRLPFYDAIYIHLWVTPFGPPLFEFFASLLNKKIIYDIDDMIFLAPGSKANNFIAKFKGKNKAIFLMKKAKHVIVCTPTLEEVAKKYNKNITDISSTINTKTYVPVNKYSNDKKITIGWSGSHSTSKYLKLLESVFFKLKQKHDFNLLAIGDASFSFEKDIAVEAISWEEKTEVANLQRIDIGVYPLPLNDQWVLGKSGLKALQYMALGIPTVATAIGANFRVIENGVSGYLVETEEEWLEKLNNLIENNLLREKIGSEASKRVEKYYSINANKSIYLNILKIVMA